VTNHGPAAAGGKMRNLIEDLVSGWVAPVTFVLLGEWIRTRTGLSPYIIGPLAFFLGTWVGVWVVNKIYPTYPP